MCELQLFLWFDLSHTHTSCLMLSLLCSRVYSSAEKICSNKGVFRKLLRSGVCLHLWSCYHVKTISHKCGRGNRSVQSFTQLVSGKSHTAAIIQWCDLWWTQHSLGSPVFSGLVLLGSVCFPAPVILLGTTTKKLILALNNDPPHCRFQGFRGHPIFLFFIF